VAGRTTFVGELALKPDGTLWAWGDNWTGQLGVGSDLPATNIPVRVGSDADWVSVTAGWMDNSLSFRCGGGMLHPGTEVRRQSVGLGSQRGRYASTDARTHRLGAGLGCDGGRNWLHAGIES